MILCAQPYMYTHAHTHTCPPEKLCSLAHLYHMEKTSLWSSSADTPEPVSPESVIHVNSVVKLHSELPAVILP